MTPLLFAQEIYEALRRAQSGHIPDTDCLECDTYAKRFRWLWNSINGNWDKNPWVWAVSFKRI